MQSLFAKYRSTASNEGHHSGAMSFGLTDYQVRPRFVREQKLVDLNGIVRGRVVVLNELRLIVAECQEVTNGQLRPQFIFLCINDHVQHLMTGKVCAGRTDVDIDGVVGRTGASPGPGQCGEEQYSKWNHLHGSASFRYVNGLQRDSNSTHSILRFGAAVLRSHGRAILPINQVAKYPDDTQKPLPEGQSPDPNASAGKSVDVESPSCVRGFPCQPGRPFIISFQDGRSHLVGLAQEMPGSVPRWGHPEMNPSVACYYSSRKAAKGSMRDALRAGRYAARIEITATPKATTMKVAGSFGRIAYTMLVIRRVTTNIIANPITVPKNASFKL